MRKKISRRAAWLGAAPLLTAATAGLLLAPNAGAASRVAAPQRLTVDATTGALTTPAHLSAGLTDVVLRHAQMSDASFALLNPGVKPAQVLAAAKSGGDPLATLMPLITPLGGPSGSGTVEGLVNLPAGQVTLYHMGQDAKGKPTFSFKFLTVGAAGAPVAAPTATATIREKDMKFFLDTPIKAGTATLKIVNQGPSLHETVIAKLNPGKTFKDLMNYFGQQKPSGPPPGEIAGGGTVMAPGHTQWVVQRFTPGDLRPDLLHARQAWPTARHGRHVQDRHREVAGSK